MEKKIKKNVTLEDMIKATELTGKPTYKFIKGDIITISKVNDTLFCINCMCDNLIIFFTRMCKNINENKYTFYIGSEPVAILHLVGV